ncbi:MAG: hypothetical protein CMJ18_22600 [Phycisphaeraceae bacterium]|nr:hypothetical protein [Phycisphaeraceae bacterium]
MVALTAIALTGVEALAEFKVVADPGREEFGFEQPSPGTNVFTLGAPQWGNVGNRITGVVQTGDGMGGGTAGDGSPNDAGLQSAMFTATSSNARIDLNASPRMLPGHTGRFSFAFQMPTGNNDFETQVYLDGVSPDSFRAVWLSFDNGRFSTRDSSAGNAHTDIGTYEGDKWYEVVWEKPVWSDGSVGQPFTVSLYDSSTQGLIGQETVSLGKAVENFGNWGFWLANSSSNFMKLDHFNYAFDDAGAALPAFVPRGPEPGTLGLLGFTGLMLLRRRARA